MYCTLKNNIGPAFIGIAIGFLIMFPLMLRMYMDIQYSNRVRLEGIVAGTEIAIIDELTCWDYYDKRIIGYYSDVTPVDDIRRNKKAICVVFRNVKTGEKMVANKSFIRQNYKIRKR